MSDSTTESERPEIIHTPDGPDDNQVVIDDTKKYIRYDIHKKKLAEVSGANEPGEGKASEVRVNARVNCMERVIAENPELLNESNKDDMNNGLWVEKPNSGEVLYLRYDFVIKTIKESAEYS